LLAQSTLNRKAITIDLAIDMINKIVKQKQARNNHRLHSKNCM
jgi:hypothetical protein